MRLLMRLSETLTLGESHQGERRIVMFGIAAKQGTSVYFELSIARLHPSQEGIHQDESTKSNTLRLPGVIK